MMRDFELWLNTRFLFGRDVHKKAGSVLRQMGVSRVLIHHDSGAYLYDTGLLESVRRDLEDNGMAVRELPGVKPNPRLDLVYEGIRCVKENQIDFILAIHKRNPRQPIRSGGSDPYVSCNGQRVRGCERD